MLTLLVFAKLYGPAIAVVCFGGMAFLVRKGVRQVTLRLKPFGDFVDVEIIISSTALVRLALATAAIASVIGYGLLDYSSLFPNQLKMDVFFDEAGIQKSLEEFTANQMSGLSIPGDYRQYQKVYYQRLDEEVKKLLGLRVFFSIREGIVHSHGQVVNTIEKLSGWQKYYMSTSEGELTHVMETPRVVRREFLTRFSKLPSRYDYLDASVVDLLLQRQVILRTEYKQMIVENRGEEGTTFRVALVAITGVRVFPWPRISNTVYLAKFETIGLVPVAYAIYR